MYTFKATKKPQENRDVAAGPRVPLFLSVPVFLSLSLPLSLSLSRSFSRSRSRFRSRSLIFRSRGALSPFLSLSLRLSRSLSLLRLITFSLCSRSGSRFQPRSLPCSCSRSTSTSLSLTLSLAVTQIRRITKELQQDRDVSAVIVRGEGRAFCAGLNFRNVESNAVMARI